MTRARVKDVLIHATQNKYGVAAINVFNYETIKWIISAAEKEKMPVIVQLYPGFDVHIPIKHVAYMACDLAEKASVPVAVHLDHSASYDIAVSGIRDGFPSVMIDGSSLPFEENVAMTSQVVRTAQVFGVDVEAELGHVGSGARVDDIINTDYYTSVEQAVKFVELTGVDSLAIAVGNAHGAYVKTPHLDFDRIKAIRSKLTIPLVLHGCSDIPDEQIRESVNLGMSKFNIATEYDRAFYGAMQKNIDFQKKNGSLYSVLSSISDEMMDFVIKKIRLLNPNKFSL